MRSLIVLAAMLVSSTVSAQCINGVCFLPQRQVQQRQVQQQAYTPSFAYAPRQFVTYYTTAPVQAPVVQASPDCQCTNCQCGLAAARQTQRVYQAAPMSYQAAPVRYVRPWRTVYRSMGSCSGGRCSQ